MLTAPRNPASSHQPPRKNGPGSKPTCDQWFSALDGLLLNLGRGHGCARTRATHVVAMGRFNVTDKDAPLALKMTLFGKKKREQTFEITLTRGKTKQVANLTPAAPTHALFTTNLGHTGGGCSPDLTEGPGASGLDIRTSSRETRI
jgi:hypothetical protein